MALSDDADEEISYLALRRGTPVASSSGKHFGKVEHVLQVPELDLFDGIVARVHMGHRFVDRDQIDKITRTVVHCHLSDQEAAALPKPSGPPVEVPEGPLEAPATTTPSAGCSGASTGPRNASR